MGNRIARTCRGALSGLFFLAYGLFALPFALLLAIPLWPRRLVRRTVRHFYRLFVACARLTGLFRVEAAPEDLRALAGLRGKIVVMNHVSLIDICVLIAHLGDSVCIAKAAAKRNPFLAGVVKTAFIANDSGAERTLSEAKACLGSGVNVIVFPEGTRVPADAPSHRLSRGAARIGLAVRGTFAAVHVSYDPPVLGKSQPWWDVGDRTVRVRLEYRGAFAAEGENDHRHAVLLTQRIKESIL